jgi:hypothetical protein
MEMLRRKAIKASGAALAGLSLGAVQPGEVLAQEALDEGLTESNL